MQSRLTKKFFITHGLHQLVKLSTHVTQETEFLIDVILTNTRSNVHHIKVLSLSLSDHDCVTCIRKINQRKMPFRTITVLADTVLARDSENYVWNPVSTETNVNIALDYMEEGLTSITDRHVSKITKRVKDRKCPWLTCEIKTLMNTRDKYSERLEKQIKSVTGIVLKGLKSKLNKLSRNIKKTYYSKTGIILLSFGTASKKCFLQRNLFISF